MAETYEKVEKERNHYRIAADRARNALKTIARNLKDRDLESAIFRTQAALEELDS